nr:hypothetical protein [uncultured Desulfobulbus sp.]
MPQKLRKDSLSAELVSIEGLLNEAREIGDVVGMHQYEHRRNIIQHEIEQIDASGALDNTASVALFFGGKPVFGSRGILADFASDALKEFQGLVSRLQATEILGELGSRGRIPDISSSQLMITELARGSFGFILDENVDQFPLVKTNLRNTVDKVVKIIEKTGGQSRDDFDEIISILDGRSLISLRKLFSNLDNSKATLRVVEGEKDFWLDEDAIQRGKARTETTTIEDTTYELEGVLVGFLPEHRKFEIRTEGEILYGTATQDAVDQFNAYLKQGTSILNEKWRVSLDIRIVTPLNRPERKHYRLVEFIEKIVDSGKPDSNN